MRKHTMLLLSLVMTCLCATGQEEGPSYAMWQTTYMTPDYKNLAGFDAAMAKHNKTYHAEGPYSAEVYNVTSGPNVGKIVWLMGPCTYSDLDNRPGDGAHDADWIANVMPHVKKLNHGEYWKMDTALSNVSGTADPFPIIVVRFHEVNKGQSHRVDAMLKKISQAVKAIEGGMTWAVFHNEWLQGWDIGRHVATVSYHQSWSEFDEDISFRKAYESVHGANSWTAFLTDMGNVFSNSWDEIWVHMPSMSGPSRTE